MFRKDSCIPVVLIESKKNSVSKLMLPLLLQADLLRTHGLMEES